MVGLLSVDEEEGKKRREEARMREKLKVNVRG